MRKPDYTQILKVLRKEVPDRPTLFEFFLNATIYEELNNGEAPERGDNYDYNRKAMYAFKNAGYDYFTSHISKFRFHSADKAHKASMSINEGNVITDWESYEKYEWPEPENFGLQTLEALAPDLPEGMKFIAYSAGGVLENTITLVGYDNLCMMLYDDPALARKVFDGVGSRLLRYYEMAAAQDSVCAIVSNDDWGFKTQTMLSTAHMREYVFPWHKKIVAAGHKNGKPVILHSCGYREDIMDDIIEDMRFDGLHSYEDAILPVEEAYERYKGRIAIIGGIDVHYVCTQPHDAITARAKAMLERSAKTGGYALGTGNSVPGYVPKESYYAMIRAVHV